MKNVTLLSLWLKNFKGVIEASYEMNSKTNIFGANESGKSTIATAFYWLLTGKDEFDRKDYELKNTKHKEYNSQAHEVEGLFLVDGKETRLKRVYLEKWTKPRGQSTKVFDGHTTDYYFNDVPCTASEYQTKVDSIIPANLIKLITNPLFFHSLDWTKQRSALLQIAGDISNIDVIESIASAKNDYGNLINELNAGKSLEEWKKQLSAKKGLLKKAADEYPTRIDEAKRNMPQAHNWSELGAEKSDIEKQIAEIDLILNDAAEALKSKQNSLMQKQKELHTKQTELANIRFKVKSGVEQQRNSGTGEIQSVEQEIRLLNQQIEQLKQADKNNADNIETYNKSIETKEAIVVKLRADWDKINAEKFEFDETNCTCPTCKQQLPETDIETTKTNLLKNFNESVINRKASKVEESNQVKKEIAQLKDKIQAASTINNAVEISTKEQSIVTLAKKLTELKTTEAAKKVEDIEIVVDALMSNNADALNVKNEIENIESDIQKEQALIDLNTDDDNTEKKTEKAALIVQLDGVKAKLNLKSTIEATEKRISDLEREMQANAQEIATLEQQEFDIETFTRAKMDILQERVNKMFQYVTFRMFEKQVNGGIAETCVCEYKGVPYPTLNTAAKLLAGLDVLNVLSKYYGITAPVFCDNRESVTEIPAIQSQVISLFVSPQDKKIRVEAA